MVPRRSGTPLATRRGRAPEANTRNPEPKPLANTNSGRCFGASQPAGPCPESEKPGHAAPCEARTRLAAWSNLPLCEFKDSALFIMGINSDLFCAAALRHGHRDVNRGERDVIVHHGRALPAEGFSADPFRHNTVTRVRQAKASRRLSGCRTITVEVFQRAEFRCVGIVAAVQSGQSVLDLRKPKGVPVTKVLRALQERGDRWPDASRWQFLLWLCHRPPSVNITLCRPSAILYPPPIERHADAVARRKLL